MLSLKFCVLKYIDMLANEHQSLGSAVAIQFLGFSISLLGTLILRVTSLIFHTFPLSFTI